MASTFSKWFGKKPAAARQSHPAYDTDFVTYGVIGVFGGFEDQQRKMGADMKLPISDDKHRKDNRHNVFGPLYVNRSLRGHIFPVIATSWSVTDPTLLVSVGKDARILTWDISDASKTAVHSVAGNTNLLMSCSVNASNKLVAGGSLGCCCHIMKRNPDTGALTDSGVTLIDHEGFIASCPFMSDTQILTGSADYTCKLFDIAKPGTALKTYNHENEVMATAPCLLPDHSAQVFYTASGGVLKLWDTRESSCDIASLSFVVPSGTDVSGLDVCKQKDYLVACGTDSGDCYVFDTRGGASRCVAACIDMDITQEVASVALSYSGNLLFAGYRKWVKNYMDCVMIAFDLQNPHWETPNPVNTPAEATGAGEATEPIIAPHCVIGGNPGITSSIPFSYSYQSITGTFMSSVQLNCDGCALSVASHDGTISVFRQQR